jgi:hypothetical protein
LRSHAVAAEAEDILAAAGILVATLAARDLAALGVGILVAASAVAVLPVVTSAGALATVLAACMGSAAKGSITATAAATSLRLMATPGPATDMSLPKTIYLFRCGESGLYAFTADPSGQILPSRIYPQIRWRFERRVTLHPDRNSPKRKIVRAILDAIAEHGFHLTHAAVNAEHCATL